MFRLNKKGLSFSETLLATLIISSIVLGMLYSQVKFNAMSEYAEHRIAALIQCRGPHRLETYMARGYTFLEYNCNESTTALLDENDPTKTSDNISCTVKRRSSRYADENGRYFKRYYIKAIWNEAGETKEVTLETMLYPLQNENWLYYDGNPLGWCPL